MKRFFKVLTVLFIALTMFTFSSEESLISAKVSGDFSYDVLADGTAEIVNYGGNASELEIPRELDGYEVTRLGYGAFSESKSLEKVIIPDSVVALGNYTFSQCTKLKEIILPESIVSLGQNTFSGCNSLESIAIPSQIKSIGYGTFNDCISLNNVVLPDGVESILGMAFAGCRNLSNIQLPTTLTTIGSGAFSDCVRLETIAIPHGVSSLGSSTFGGCISLREIQLPETIVGIGQSAFQDCISLEKITLPNSITAIGYSAFSGCSSLVEVNIPTSITSINNAMFSGCGSLKIINIPNSVTSLGENVFSGCTALESIDLPDSITSIGQSAFSNCSELREVKLPKNLSTLEVNLFRYCDSLENIVIPNGVTSIKATAFADCINLKSVIIPSTVTSFGSRVFSNCPELTIYGVTGSEAQIYAQKEVIPFKALGTGLNLDTNELSLKVNTSHKFNAVLYPYTVVENERLTWTSSDSAIASINTKGVVSAHKTGTVTITAKTSNGIVATCIVNVNANEIPITSLDFNKESITMKKDTTDSITATITPQNTTDSKTITWESSDTEVATVSSTGKITARKPGTVVISAISSNSMKASCSVIVLSEIKTVTLNSIALTMDAATNQTLRATINPSDTTDDKALVWTSSNERIATVDQNGNVRAKEKGTATITVTTTNGKKAECKITVVDAVEIIPIESVSLNFSKLTIEKGNSQDLVATINPSNTTENKTLVWSSEDTAIAKVDQNGRVSGNSKGTTTIWVETVNDKKAKCEVTVSDVDLDELSQLILSAEAVDPLVYTVDSYAVLSDALVKAIAVQENNTATQEAIDAEVLRLSTALSTLVERASLEDINSLQMLTNECRALESDFSESVFAKMKQLIVDSDAILSKENGNISKTEVQEITTKILLEKENLILEESLLNLNNTIQVTKDVLAGNIENIKPITIEKLKDVLKEAELFVAGGNHNIDEITAMNDKLTTALSNLEGIEDVQVLNDFILYAESINADNYTASSWEAVANALQHAKNVAQDKNASNEEIGTAYKQLVNAISNLKSGTDKSSLRLEISIAEDILANKNKYVASSIKDLDGIYKEALSVYNDDGASQETISDVVKRLTKVVLKARLKAN